MSAVFGNDLDKVLCFPALVVSKAGWSKLGQTALEISDASPDDDLSNWRGAAVYDSAGRRFLVERCFVKWPATAVGRLSARLFDHVIHVGMVLEELAPLPLEDFKALACELDGIEPKEQWTSQRNVLDALWQERGPPL